MSHDRRLFLTRAAAVRRPHETSRSLNRADSLPIGQSAGRPPFLTCCPPFALIDNAHRHAAVVSACRVVVCCVSVVHRRRRVMTDRIESWVGRRRRDDGGIVMLRQRARSDCGLVSLCWPRLSASTSGQRQAAHDDRRSADGDRRLAIDDRHLKKHDRDLNEHDCCRRVRAQSKGDQVTAPIGAVGNRRLSSRRDDDGGAASSNTIIAAHPQRAADRRKWALVDRVVQW